MKSLKMRNALILVLSFVFALSMLVFAGTVKPVNAEETTTTVEAKFDHFKVMEGAQIRLGKGENSYAGIRFIVEMNEATKAYVDQENVTLGFIITPKVLFDQRQASVDSTGEALKYGKDDYVYSISNYVGNHITEITSDTDKLGIEVDESKIYDDVLEDGTTYYYANGAVENLKENNVNADLAYTVIAYIATDITTTDSETNESVTTTTFDYAVPSIGFSRTYKETAGNAYMGGYALATLKTTQYLTNFASETDPVGIYDGDALYDLAKSVNTDGIDFKNSYFKLKNNVKVDSDFTQISSNFAGDFVASDYTVKRTNIGNVETVPNVLETADAELPVVNAYDLITPSLSVQDYATVPSNDRATKEYVSKEDLPTHDSSGNSIDNSIGYNGNAFKYTKAKAQDGYFYLKPNFTKTELNEMLENKEFYSVRFYYLVTETSVHNNYSETSTQKSIMNSAGYNSTSKYKPPVNIWQVHTVQLSDMLESFNQEQRIVIFRTNSAGINIYIGNIELVETPIIYDGKVAANSVANINLAKDRTATEFSISPARAHKNTLPTVSRNGLAIDNSVVQNLAIKQEAGGGQKSFYAKLLYTASDIKELAKNEDGSYKYKIQITYLIDSTNSPWYDTWNGAIDANKIGSWQTVILDVDTFTSKMGRMEYTYSDSGTTYSTDGYGDTEDATTGIKPIDKMVFLCGGTRSTTMYFYLADISFVPVA